MDYDALVGVLHPYLEVSNSSLKKSCLERNPQIDLAVHDSDLIGVSRAPNTGWKKKKQTFGKFDYFVFIGASKFQNKTFTY